MTAAKPFAPRPSIPDAEKGATCALAFTVKGRIPVYTTQQRRIRRDGSVMAAHSRPKGRHHNHVCTASRPLAPCEAAE